MTNTPQNPPAGYYPDQNGVQRYWDGSAWTDQTQVQPAITSPPASMSAPTHSAASRERPWFKKKRFVVPGALAALLIAASAVGGGGGASDGEEPATSAAVTQKSEATDTDVKADATSDAEEKAADELEAAVKKKAAAKKKAAEKPELTSGQENALAAAENYLSFAPFSHDGLIRQLSSEYGDGYSKADATYAADHVDVDYKEQAAKAAENYLDISPFSRSGMITQLTSSAGDQYTQAQAEYGATQAGL
jgi:hypothetical protein